MGSFTRSKSRRRPLPARKTFDNSQHWGNSAFRSDTAAGGAPAPRPPLLPRQSPPRGTPGPPGRPGGVSPPPPPPSPGPPRANEKKGRGGGGEADNAAV